MGSILGWTLVNKKGELAFMRSRNPIFYPEKKSLKNWKIPGEKVVRARLTWVNYKKERP